VDSGMYAAIHELTLSGIRPVSLTGFQC